MSDDLLKRVRGPLQQQRVFTTTLTRFATSGPDWGRDGRLYGLRGTFKPTMALRTMQRLGDVRHALAQRAIAGFLEIHAPFAPELSDEAKERVEKTEALRARTIRNQSGPRSDSQ